MLRLHQLVVSLDDYPKLDEGMLRRLCAARLKIKEDRILQVRLQKRSVDARGREGVHFTVTVDALLKDAAGEEKIAQKFKPNQVGYLHESVSFVRGKYAREEVCGSGMLLTKCSHDLDIMSWLMGNNVPTSISSVGGVFQFKEEKAPEGAGTHCLNDCQLERECPFSARRLYIEHPMRWSNNVWHDTGTAPATDAEKEKILRRPDNPFSRCVHRCNISIVDHQSVLIHYQDGAIGTFTMNGGASTPRRLIHVTGTRGEIYGTFEDECFCVRQIEPGAPGGYTERTLDMSDFQQGDAHGGGDRSIVLDFVALLRGERTSPGCPTLEDSITGHRMVFLAEESRMRGGAMLPW